jgi:membrane fusion protein, multidrug efflux system
MSTRKAVIGVVVLSVATTLVGCRGQKAEQQPPPPAVVTVIRPATAPVRDYWMYNGYLEATETVEVRSKIRGFLTKVEFVEGTEVEKDAPLYKIDEREYVTAMKKAEAELAKSKAEVQNWKAQIKLATAELRRVEDAARAGGASSTDLDKAKATLEVNNAEHAAAEATRDAAEQALKSTNIQLSYTDIRARIGGRISRTLVHVGNLVQADTTLMTTIVRVDELYVNFDAPEVDLMAFQRAMASASQSDPSGWQLPVEVGVAGEEGYPHVGRIDFRENRVDTASGTLRIRGRVANPLRANNVRLLYPGLYARVRVPKGEPTRQLVIPEDCLLTGQEGRFVYVVGAGGKVEKRIVTLGPVVFKAPPQQPGVAPPSWVAVNPAPPPPREGQPPATTRRQVKSMVAITAGLKTEDSVILDGLQRARPGAEVKPEEWNLLPPAPPKGAPGKS